MKRDKEWFIKELLGHEIGDYGNYYNGGYEDGLAYALKLAHQLDEPEKVVIPQFVADWWERDDDSVTLYGGLRIEKNRKLYLISKFYDIGLGDFLSKVVDWLDENNSIFLDLVNGKPYEVEKEPSYLAQVKGHSLTGSSDTYWHVVNDLYVVLAGRNEIMNGENKLTLEEWADFGITSENAEFTEVEE